MRQFFAALIIAFALTSAAQEGAKKIDAPDANPTRPRSSDELNKESSSFVPDPDSLDPLPVKKENLKEDEEPVLEDIRQVIDAPPTVKAAPSKAQSTKKEKVKYKAGSASGGKVKNKSTAKSTIPKKIITVAGRNKISRKNKKVLGRGLRDDDPDLSIENNFHKIYNTYNAEPTSIEGWTAALKGRDSETYTVQKNDTLWSISKTLFGDPNYWPKLWALNKRGILNPHFITPGLQVVFYAGSAEEIPSLALADDQDSDASEDTSSPAGAPANSKMKNATKKMKAKRESVGTKEPSPIPDSLPISRNDNFFLPKKNLKVELLNQPDIPDDFTNDIILTDRKIISEVEVTEDEILKGRCGGDHVLKTSQIQGSEGTLKVYEALQSLDTDAGDIFPYRYVGEAQALSDKKIRITACRTVISPALYFLSPSKVDSWRTRKISKQAVPVIIGSPNIVEQLIFMNHQLAYINLGANPAEVGQTVSVQSQLTERVSGEIRIIDKFGSFAIGIVTDVQDLIETGDEVRLK